MWCPRRTIMSRFDNNSRRKSDCRDESLITDPDANRTIPARLPQSGAAPPGTIRPAPNSPNQIDPLRAGLIRPGLARLALPRVGGTDPASPVADRSGRTLTRTARASDPNKHRASEASGNRADPSRKEAPMTATVLSLPTTRRAFGARSPVVR